MIEIREKRLADNRHINFQMLGEKGTKLYFSSLKSRTMKTKINMLGTEMNQTTDPLEITNRITSYFTKAFKQNTLHTSIHDQTDLNSIKDIITNDQKTWLTTDYTTAEISYAIGKLRDSSSPGMDGMTSKITKLIASRDIVKFTSMVTCYVRMGSARASLFWLKILPKPGKSDYSTLKSFRPISLINTICKVADNALVARINKILDSSVFFCVKA